MDKEKDTNSEGGKLHKKNKLQKMTRSVFNSEDNSVGHYIIDDVVAPTIKKSVSDIVSNVASSAADLLSNFVDALLYGEDAPTIRKNKEAAKTSYSSYSRDKKEPRRSILSMRSISRFHADEITFANRTRAELAKKSLESDIINYGNVSLYEYCEKVLSDNELNDIPWTYKDYVWDDPESIRESRVIRAGVSGEYFIDLPEPRPIK